MVEYKGTGSNGLVAKSSAIGLGSHLGIGSNKVWVFKGHMVGRCMATTLASFPLISNREGRKEMFYLTTHSTHFINGYMASDIW